MLDKLPSEFDDFKKKYSHYVCRIKDQVGRLKQEIWFGMANGLLYPNPRKGVQYQVGIDRSKLTFNGIWIEGTYDARATRLEVTSRLNDKKSQFIRILRRLGAGFTLEILDSKGPIPTNNLSEADVDYLIYELPRHGNYAHIGKPIPKKEAIALGDRILDEILKTASELLPVYRLLNRRQS